MPRIVCIVEGEGEVEALPILLRRIGNELDNTVHFDILRPIRIPASKFIQPGALERYVDLAANKAGPNGSIFILRDSDNHCPAELGPDLLARAQTRRSDRNIAVVLAKQEYEAWFIASIESLRGKRGLDQNINRPKNPEAIRDAKGWLTNRMVENKAYSETIDQPALTALFDMQTARRFSDSFEKFYREALRILTKKQR